MTTAAAGGVHLATDDGSSSSAADRLGHENQISICLLLDELISRQRMLVIPRMAMMTSRREACQSHAARNTSSSSESRLDIQKVC